MYKRQERKVRTEVLVNPGANANLLAASDVIGPTEALYMNKEGAYIVPDKVPATAEQVAIKEDGMYVARAVVTADQPTNTKKQAQAAVHMSTPRPESKPRLRRKTESKSSDPEPVTPGPKQVKSTQRKCLRWDRRKFTVPKYAQHKVSHLTLNDLKELHLRFNHASVEKLKRIYRQRRLKLPQSKLTCSACLRAKMRRAPHHRTKHEYQPGEVICSDVAGPLSAKGDEHGEHSILTIMDVGSRFLRSIPISSKTSAVVSSHLRQAVEENIKLFGDVPQMLVTDNAREFVMGKTRSLCEEYHLSLIHI